LCRVRKRRTPDQAQRPTAEEVCNPSRGNLVDERRIAERWTFDQPVPASIDPIADLAKPDVQEVRHAVAVEVGDQQTIGIKLSRFGEVRRTLHCDGIGEPPMTEMRPVLDATVADAQLMR